MSMSSQCAKAWVMAAWVSGSASRKLSSVASENTTPKPKVSSGRLRSSTVISCAGSAFFMRIAKYNPAGPPPTETIFTRSFYRTSPVRNVHVQRRLSRDAAGIAVAVEETHEEKVRAGDLGCTVACVARRPGFNRAGRGGRSACGWHLRLAVRDAWAGQRVRLVVGPGELPGRLSCRLPREGHGRRDGGLHGEAAGAAARRLTRFAARLAQRARHRPLRPRTVRLATLTQRARPTPASLHSRGEEPPRHLEAVASQARLAERDQREEPAEPRVEGRHADDGIRQRGAGEEPPLDSHRVGQLVADLGAPALLVLP